MQSETLAQEFARLVKEYNEGDDHTKPEAWNLLADYAVDNADAITAALSEKQAAEVKIKPLEVEEVGDPEAWLFHEPSERRIMVRPLRWKGPDSSGEYHSLDGLWGYILRAKNGNGFWLTEVGGYFPTVEAARAAAQSDYEQRIRSALVDVPVEPVAWLRSCRITYLSGEERDGHVVTNKHDPRAFPVYISPPLSHRGEDSAAPVQDTWFTDRALPVMAMSADVESNRILKLHFRRPVTDDDRKALCDALNMHQAALAATRSGSASATTASGGDHG